MRRRAADSPGEVVQDSPLLNLPPELRDLIYNYSAQVDEALIFKGIGQGALKVAPPALARTCNQINDEYCGIYMSEAPRFATKVISHVPNFDAEAFFPMMKSLPDAATDVHRKFVFHLHLDNFFDRPVGHMTRFFSSMSMPMRRTDALDGGLGPDTPLIIEREDYEIYVSYNPKSFSVRDFRHSGGEVRIHEWYLDEVQGGPRGCGRAVRKGESATEREAEGWQRRSCCEQEEGWEGLATSLL